MRRVVLLLAVIFMTAPAMAVTSLEIVDLGGCWAEIRYDAIGEAELPRAFGLRISVSGDGSPVIEEVDVTSTEPYDIYLGTIEFEGDPLEIKDPNPLYSPVAPSDDPGAAGTGLNTDTIVVEMASLYNVITLPPADIPADSGLLIKVKVSENCLMSVVVDSTRGGVVMEDGNAPAPDVSQATSEPVTCIVEEDCVKTTAPFYQEWLGSAGSARPLATWTKPDCWCYERNCRGDVDNCKEAWNSYWVYSIDYDLLKAAYGLLDNLVVGSYICANFDHLWEAWDSYAVYDLDFDIVKQYYGLLEGNVPTCPLNWDGLSNPDADDYNFLIPGTPDCGM